MTQLILASASPRRKELLSDLGLDFQIAVPDVDESVLAGESPEEMVKRVSLLKAKKIAGSFPAKIVLAADTTVAIELQGKLQILGKPESPEEAEKMLENLSGKTHLVHTGYAIIWQDKNTQVCGVVKTEVTFDHLSITEIKTYVATGEPMDKAGAYGIQGRGARLVSTISGSYTNVVGLPLTEVCRGLEKVGFKL